MATTVETPREKFLALLEEAVRGGALGKLTLGKPAGGDPTLKNLFVRPVTLKAGPQLSFVWRYATRDVTKNRPPEDGLREIGELLGATFRDAHLFTNEGSAQLETQADGSARLHQKKSATPAARSAPPGGGHDAAKTYAIPAEAPWLRALGVTNERGQPREGMRDKFRQIQKFAELLGHLLTEVEAISDRRSVVSDQAGAISSQRSAVSPGNEAEGEQEAKFAEPAKAIVPLRILDAGAGKGYLTFALAALLGERAEIEGVEARPELVALCNRVARESGLRNLRFTAGLVGMKAFVPGTGEKVAPLDGLIALHACDTATDDALARGIAAGARLLVVAPCCQKELRPQLEAPPVLAEALRHGIFQERTAEFVTDALRAQLLEWAGYRTKVFEFISTEHTAKNLMIAAIKTGERGTTDDARARRVREFAAFYGIERQALARQLGFELREK